jgi:hypothetical protein
MPQKEKVELDDGMNKIGGIMLLILFFSLIGGYFVTNSDEYISRKYKEFNEYSFEGEVYDKKEDQKGGGANVARYLHLKTGIIHRVNISKYYDVQIGDYVYKPAKSDTVYYIVKKKDTIKAMENSYLKDYLKTMSKE